MGRPLVLVSNDDGFRAAGIRAMAEALRDQFEVVVCAPDSEQSASSHSLSLNRPLRLEAHEPGVFSVDGTPADSVYVALHAESVLSRKPDLVVSGMNHGLNLGQDVFYSGTVAAAREGALQGIPALAVSADFKADLARAAANAAQLAQALVHESLGKPALFNVNYPSGTSWRRCVTTSGRRHYSGGLVERKDPRGRSYYWVGGDQVHHEGPDGTDTYAFDSGLVGVTPLVLDLTHDDLKPSAVRLCELAARLGQD